MTPVGLGVSGVDDDVEEEDDDVGGDGRAVVHEEHDGQADKGSEKWKPAIEVLEGWTPSWWSKIKFVILLQIKSLSYTFHFAWCCGAFFEDFFVDLVNQCTFQKCKAVQKIRCDQDVTIINR